MTYKEKLEHPKWQRRRQDILVRDNYQCAFCGDTETQVHVHHKYYTRGAEPWDYPDDAFQTLCKHCHIIITDHQKGSIIMEVLAIRKQKSSNCGTWYFQVLTVHDNNKYSICLYRINESVELEFMELIPHSQFNGTLELINLAKSLNNGE